jgi:hypothetical protein
MEARQISDQILSCFETEDTEHEILGHKVEPLDARRRREFDTVALERRLAENRTTTAGAFRRHADDDDIVVNGFQEIGGGGRRSSGFDSQPNIRLTANRGPACWPFLFDTVR